MLGFSLIKTFEGRGLCRSRCREPLRSFRHDIAAPAHTLGTHFGPFLTPRSLGVRNANNPPNRTTPKISLSCRVCRERGAKRNANAASSLSAPTPGNAAIADMEKHKKRLVKTSSIFGGPETRAFPLENTRVSQGIVENRLLDRCKDQTNI